MSYRRPDAIETYLSNVERAAVELELLDTAEEDSPNAAWEAGVARLTWMDKATDAEDSQDSDVMVARALRMRAAQLMLQPSATEWCGVATGGPSRPTAAPVAAASSVEPQGAVAEVEEGRRDSAGACGLAQLTTLESPSASDDLLPLLAVEVAPVDDGAASLSVVEYQQQREALRARFDAFFSAPTGDGALATLLTPRDIRAEPL